MQTDVRVSHLIYWQATNMCIWLYVIIEETKHDVINAHDGNLTHRKWSLFAKKQILLQFDENSNLLLFPLSLLLVT